MVTVDRKLRQRIARRTEKMRRLIGEEEANLAVLDSADYPRREDYLRALRLARGKLHRLKRELLALEAGRLPGPWGGGPAGGTSMTFWKTCPRQGCRRHTMTLRCSKSPRARPPRPGSPRRLRRN